MPPYPPLDACRRPEGRPAAASLSVFDNISSLEYLEQEIRRHRMRPRPQRGQGWRKGGAIICKEEFDRAWPFNIVARDTGQRPLTAVLPDREPSHTVRQRGVSLQSRGWLSVFFPVRKNNGGKTGLLSLSERVDDGYAGNFAKMRVFGVDCRDGMLFHRGGKKCVPEME